MLKKKIDFVVGCLRQGSKLIGGPKLKRIQEAIRENKCFKGKFKSLVFWTNQSVKQVINIYTKWKTSLNLALA